jgi:phosphinothricin acetyltransferase
MEVSVRPARAGDRAAVVAIYNHYVRTSPATFEVRPVTVEDRAAWFDEHSGAGPYRLLVATDGDGPVLGWATTSPFRPRAAYATTVEASVYCRPGKEGLGIGSRLYSELFRAVENEDLERIVAGIALPNPRSVALHRRFGFRRVGVFTRVGRKFGRFWDVAWFERPVRPTAAGAGIRARARAFRPHASPSPAGTAGPASRPRRGAPRRPASLT